MKFVGLQTLGMVLVPQAAVVPAWGGRGRVRVQARASAHASASAHAGGSASERSCRVNCGAVEAGVGADARGRRKALDDVFDLGRGERR